MQLGLKVKKGVKKTIYLFAQNIHNDNYEKVKA
jgi:hypothetical protein